MIKKLDRLPAEFAYIPKLLEDATWLILTEIERRETFKAVTKKHPREIVLKISLVKNEKQLPISTEQVIRVGKPYQQNGLLEYCSGEGDMGMPDWYFTNPLEYWEEKASVNYLQVKPEFL